MALSKDAILGAEDSKTVTVEVPEWRDPVTGDCKVRIRGLDGEGLDAYQASIRQFRPRLDGKGMELVLVQDNTHAVLLVKCLVDEHGERIFTDADASALGKKNGKVLDRLFDIASDLSGLSEEEQDAIEGNSAAATSGASPSSSPASSAAPAPN